MWRRIDPEESSFIAVYETPIRVFKIGDMVQVSYEYDEMPELAGLVGKVVDIEPDQCGIDFGIAQASRLENWPEEDHGLWNLSRNILPKPTGRYIPNNMLAIFDPNHDKGR